MPFDFGIGEIAIVVVIGLLVFGPKRLPEITKSLGSGMRDFRKGMSGELDPEPAAAPAAAPAPAPAAAAPVPAEPAVMPAPPVEPAMGCDG